MEAATRHTPMRAIVALIIAATLWGVYWIPLRWLEGLGMSGPWTVLLIYIGTFVYIIPIIIKRRQELTIEPHYLVLIAITTGWCNVAFSMAMLEGDVVRGMLLFYISPVWATLLGWLFLKEHISVSAFAALCLTLFGAAIVLWKPEVGYPWPSSIADWYAISSGVAFAFTNMFIHMASKTSIQIKTSISWLGVMLVSILFIIVLDSPINSSDVWPNIAAILVGIFFMGIMTFTVVYGVTHLPVHKSAIILLFEVIIGAISAYLFADEIIGAMQILGGVLVLTGTVIIAYQHYNDLNENKLHD